MKIVRGAGQARVRLAASDAANFLACRRLTQLDLLRARGELRPPREYDVGFAELVRRGEVHEQGVLERFRADGLEVVDVSAADRGRTRDAAVRAAGFPGAGGPAARASGRRAGGGRAAARPDLADASGAVPLGNGRVIPPGKSTPIISARPSKKIVTFRLILLRSRIQPQ